jgi:hypothetical protein
MLTSCVNKTTSNGKSCSNGRDVIYYFDLLISHIKFERSLAYIAACLNSTKFGDRDRLLCLTVSVPLKTTLNCKGNRIAGSVLIKVLYKLII